MQSSPMGSVGKWLEKGPIFCSTPSIRCSLPTKAKPYRITVCQNCHLYHCMGLVCGINTGNVVQDKSISEWIRDFTIFIIEKLYQLVQNQQVENLKFTRYPDKPSKVSLLHLLLLLTKFVQYLFVFTSDIRQTMHQSIWSGLITVNLFILVQH